MWLCQCTTYIYIYIYYTFNYSMLCIDKSLWKRINKIFWKKFDVVNLSPTSMLLDYFTPKIKLICDFFSVPHIYYTFNYSMLCIDKYQLKIINKIFILPTSESHWVTFSCLCWYSFKAHWDRATRPPPFKMVMITKGESNMGRHFDLAPFKAEPDLHWSFSVWGELFFSRRLFFIFG